MKPIFFSALLLLMAIPSFAQADTPTLEFVCELQVKCEAAYTVGNTSHGKRIVIPIVGGTFKGPKMQGTIIPGGADYQLQDTVNNRTELEAIYSIRTDDGVNIHVRNCGICAQGNDAEGNPSFYFRTAPKFEAPNDSKYAWLNNAIYVCAPSFGGPQGYVILRVWMVK